MEVGMEVGMEVDGSGNGSVVDGREIKTRRGLEIEIFAVAACLLLLLLAVAPACLYVPCLPGRVVPALALVLVLVLLFLAWCCWLAWRWCCWSSASGLVTTFFKAVGSATAKCTRADES
jgi:hypothetical protein